MDKVPEDVPVARSAEVEEERKIEFIQDVDLEVAVEFGRIETCVRDILRWKPGQVLQVGRNEDQPLEIRINGRLVGGGEVVVVNDTYGIRVTSVVDPDTS